MSKEKTNYIKVYSSFKDSMVILPVPILFLILIGSNIEMYFVQRKPIGFAFVLSVVFILGTLALSIFLYSLYADSMVIDGDTLRIRKWNLRSKNCNISDIDKVVFEDKGDGIFAATIKVGDFSCKFTDTEIGFKQMKKYLLDRLSDDRFEYVIYNDEDNNKKVVRK